MRTINLFRGWSLAGCYAAMLVIGLLMAIYGPIVAVLQNRFDVTGAEVGAALGTQSFGAVVGVLLAQFILRTRANRFTVITALVLITVGAIVISVAPTWAVLLVGTAIAGLGFGGIDSIITQLILIGSGTKGQGRVNLAHAWFGVGTVMGPGMIYLVGADNYRWVFAGAALVTVLALIGVTGLVPRPTPAEVTANTEVDEGISPSTWPHAFALAVAGFFFLYFIHFAVQAGIGNWAPTIIEEQSHVDPDTSALFISGFWAALVLGRFGAATMSNRLTPGVLVTVSSIGLAISVGFTTFPQIAPWAFIIAGIFLGPIFPTGLAWLSGSGYGRGNVLAYVIAGSMLGMAIAPSLVGWIIEKQGTETAPFVLLVMAVLVVVASGALLAFLPRNRVMMQTEE